MRAGFLLPLAALALLHPSHAVAATPTHPDGTVVRGPGGQLSLISASSLRAIPSTAVMSSQRLDPARVKTATGADLALRGGAPLGLRPGTLVQGSGNVILRGIHLTGPRRRLGESASAAQVATTEAPHVRTRLKRLLCDENARR